MKLSEIKKHLGAAEAVNFKLASGEYVPEHFHVTEIGLVSRHFIDCGGTERFEKIANFQLWDANDFEHRLKPQKLAKIIALSEKVLGMEDLEIEVEYQTDTIGKYGLYFNGTDFELVAKQTACLASERCGAATTTVKDKLNEMSTQVACCGSGGTC
jgi:hypothetical protein